MRKYYIDNIRILCILLLFPFHTCMFFNNYGVPFYVLSKPVKAFSYFTIFVYPWWMTLLFTLAGISSAYALKKRSGREYIRERALKLLLPFFVGLILIIPVQCYIADIFHNGYSGSYFEHYKIFFTRFTDFTGYDGGFTPAHTWFMLYLFVISLIALPLMLWYSRKDKKIDGRKITMPILIPLFLLIFIMSPVLDISGKSVGEFLTCFLIGFFLLSIDEVQERLMKYRLPLTVLWILLMFLRCIPFYINQWNDLWDLEQRMLAWFGILAILGLGKKYLDFNSTFTRYFSPAAFPIYYFHQSILIITAYFAVKITGPVLLQFAIILTVSFAATMLCYEFCRRFTVTCLLFGIKKYKKQVKTDLL